MIDIILQTNTSENNKLDKTITNITTLSGVLKQKTSILSPVLILECDLSTLVNCNYLTIPSFNRSYFVDDIQSINNDMVEISAHCDVLTTYKNQIRQNTAIIKKQENEWNLYLNDGSFKIYQNPNVITKPFPNGFNTFEFVLAVAGS